MIGKSILHYRILEKLGEGGMGVVYLAEDSRLKRQVAIKFLPGHIAANSDERKRFEIEAQAAAALNHPNIATIHAIEETEENLFLVMEYISGKHLKNHINGHPLAMEEAVDIAIQIARGLQAAHKKGIVHRDIKSANIMSTEDGQVRIMDFGLAKFRGSAQLTQIGTTIGTAAYMSPEQARGEEADHRSDIWSFGVVFYEMLTGHPPFKGEYEQALIFNLLNEDIVPVTEVNPEIPQEINAIVIKCLHKDREQRYQSVDEVLSDLKSGSGSKIDIAYSQPKLQGVTQKDKKLFFRWPYIAAALLIILSIAWLLFVPGSVSTESTKKMMVVLPFENLGSTEDDYFADGITSEITGKLSGLSELGVIARSSAMQYKNSQKSLRQIGEELGVQYVLEGTVQWEQLKNGARRVRVNPELIQLDTDTQIWSRPYEADFSSAFKLQADIAATVADAMNLTLLTSEKHNLEEKITDNSAAYDLYLRAINYSYDIENEKNSRIAIQLFLQAIDLDENFAAAYAGLSTVQSNMYWEYYERTKENLENARINAQKALAIDPDLAAGHAAMGDYYYHGMLEYESALTEYNKALKIKPYDVDANVGVGSVLRRQGKMRQAIEYFEKTFEVDPKNYTTVFSTGETYILLRQYIKAVPFLDKAISIAPDASTPYMDKSVIEIMKNGNIKNARNIILKALQNKIGSNYSPFKYQLYLYDVYEGDFESALNQVNGTIEFDEQFYYKPEDLLIGDAYRLKGEYDLAGKHYRMAVQVLSRRIKESPDDSRLYASLGLVYAGLGQKSEAISAGEKGYNLLPVSREAWRGSWRMLDLAQIYATVGEKLLAIKTIGELLNMPTDALSVSLLKIDPVWDPIRSEPGFKQLVERFNTDTNDL